MRMIRWMKKFNNLLLENRIRTYLNSVYVDDQSWAGRALREGVRWDKKKREMRWRVEWEEEDREKGEKNDIRSFRELREMGNSIDEDIRMKEDVPSLNPDSKLTSVGHKNVGGARKDRGGSGK